LEVAVTEDRIGRTHRLRWWVTGAVAVVVVLAVASPFVYIHFIEGLAPAKLTLPRTANNAGTGSTSGTSKGSRTSAGTVAGTWNVGPGSVAGYRVDEVLIGQHATAVGRSTEVSGSITISGTTVAEGDFTVNMASVTSDQSQRNAQFDGRIMDVAMYPTATLRLSTPIALGTVPVTGSTAHYSATGTLTMHGVTRSVTFAVAAERLAGSIDVLADVQIRFSAWNIANPSIGGFVTTADSGTLEVLLHLTQGSGNAPASGGSGSASNGSSGGAPSIVTVPRTTVPPLTIPASS
jgi:polyisoprenoid-binding protein YceI